MIAYVFVNIQAYMPTSGLYIYMYLYLTRNNISTSDTDLQLKEKHFQTLEDAMMEAKDREKWRGMVQDRSFSADNGHQ